MNTTCNKSLNGLKITVKKFGSLCLIVIMKSKKILFLKYIFREMYKNIISTV